MGLFQTSGEPMTQKRWLAKVYYIDGRSTDAFEIDELEELQDIVEGGPDFGLIQKIEIFYNLGNI